MIDLSIVIVTYNSEKEISSAIESVQTTMLKHSYEMLVVDNNSQDKTLEVLKRYKDVSVFPQKNNLGYGAASNLGAKKAKGKYLLFLNPDTTVSAGALDILVETMQTHSTYGAVVALLTDQSGHIQVQGGALPTLGNVARWMLFLDDLPGVPTLFPAYQSKPSVQSEAFLRRGWVGGTALMMPRTLFEKLNGWDEQLFMYAEDVELCLRIHNQGYEIGIVPQSMIQHQQHASAGKAAARIGELKGLLYIWKKHYPRWQYPYLLALLRFGAWLRILVFGILQRNGELKRIYIDASKSLGMA